MLQLRAPCTVFNIRNPCPLDLNLGRFLGSF
ncbi:hypothetical protein HBA_0007 [Sodalis endosymbiont of Henestaris halophilus]|nr:hypothetical protein HBA_0007 [Sodalis endosymbiont of Henestaris halophilus]